MKMLATEIFWYNLFETISIELLTVIHKKYPGEGKTNFKNQHNFL